MVPKRTSSKQIRDILGCEKASQLKKVLTSPVINHLFWLGAVCPHYHFCVQQAFEWPFIYKARISKVSSTLRIDSLEKELNKNYLPKQTLLWTKIFLVRVSSSHLFELFLDSVETVSSLSDFSQQMRSINEHFPDIYFTFLDAAVISPTLILNQNAQTTERGSWVPPYIWTSAATNAVHTRW